MLDFQPQTLASIAPTLSFDEALHRVLGWSQRETDIKVYASDVETLADMVVVSPPAERWNRLMCARRVLLDALAGGDLRGFLWHPTRDICFQVPRVFWFQRDEVTLDAAFEGGENVPGGGVELNGAKPLLSSREVDAWLTAGRRKLDEIDAPPPPPVKRVRVSPRQKAVVDFLRHFEQLENPMCEPHGLAFYRVYKAWCAKSLRPSFGRTGWYEALNLVRSDSAITSTNGNRGGR